MEDLAKWALNVLFDLLLLNNFNGKQFRSSIYSAINLLQTWGHGFNPGLLPESLGLMRHLI